MAKKEYANAYKKKNYNGLDYESEKESKLYKKSLQLGDAKIAEKIGTTGIELAKKRRDKLQAQHITPGGARKDKPGPHKVDVHRRDLKPLIKWLPEKAQEKTLKFADKMDKKLETHYKKKKTKKKMQDRAKKLTTYKGYT